MNVLYPYRASFGLHWFPPLGPIIAIRRQETSSRIKHSQYLDQINALRAKPKVQYEGISESGGLRLHSPVPATVLISPFLIILTLSATSVEIGMQVSFDARWHWKKSRVHAGGQSEGGGAREICSRVWTMPLSSTIVGDDADPTVRLHRSYWRRYARRAKKWSLETGTT